MSHFLWWQRGDEAVRTIVVAHAQVRELPARKQRGMTRQQSVAQQKVRSVSSDESPLEDVVHNVVDLGGTGGGAVPQSGSKARRVGAVCRDQPEADCTLYEGVS
jgi:hypothetical protein